MHAFGMSERYLILAEYPLRVNPLEIAAHGQAVHPELQAGGPSSGTRFQRLRPRHRRAARQLRDRRVLQLPPRQRVRPRRRAGGRPVRLRGRRRSSTRSTSTTRVPAGTLPPVELRRYTIDLDGGGVRSERLAEGCFELPRIDYGAATGATTATRTASASDGGWIDQLVKVDVRDGVRSEWAEDGCYPGEPVFVREPRRATRRTAASRSRSCSMRRAGRSFLLVLDAGSLDRAGARRGAAPHPVRLPRAVLPLTAASRPRSVLGRSASVLLAGQAGRSGASSRSGARPERPERAEPASGRAPAGRLRAGAFEALPTRAARRPGRARQRRRHRASGAPARWSSRRSARAWSSAAGAPSRSRRPSRCADGGAHRGARPATSARRTRSTRSSTRVLERHGRIDLLVNNAGGQFLTPAEDITPKGFRTVIRLNVEGTWLMTHAVATKAMIPARRRQDRQRHALAAQRPAGDGAQLGGARRGREPHARALDRVGALRHPADGARGRPLRHRHAAHEVPEAGRRGRGEHASRWAGSGPRRSSPGWSRSSPRPAATTSPGAVLTIDGARDNWFGPWPPTALTDAGGKPLAEERKP